MGVSDQELVKHFQNGHKDAFIQLVKRYQDKIYNTTYRMLGNKEDAEDAAQETFIKVFNYLDKFNYNSSFSTWLFKVTTNHCRDILRKRKNSIDFITDDLNKDRNIEDKKLNPEKISLQQELRKEIQSLIDALPVSQREVLILREFQDLSYKEIAKILNISLGTVKSRISRGRMNLRSDLNKIIERRSTDGT